MAASCAAIVLVGLGASSPAESKPFDKLIVAAGPVTLSAADPVTRLASGSLAVTNPTTADFHIAPAERGTSKHENRCEVKVSTGDVEAGTSASIPFTVASTDDCPDLTVAGLELVLMATSDAPGTKPQHIHLMTAKAATTAEVKPTGVKLPTDTVFLRRSGTNLVGTMEVANTTTAAVRITPSTVEDDCTVVPAKPTTKVGTEIAAGASAPVDISIPASCDQLDAGTLDLTVLAHEVDGPKYDYGTVPVEAEVDWAAILWPAVAITVAGFAIAFGGGWVAVRKVQRKEKGIPGLSFADPLVASADAPKSWLTAIATVGPLTTTLFSTTGLLKGITGSDATAPTTLVLVATAIALVLVGIATVITNIPAITVTVDGKQQECPKIWHFLVAAALTGISAGIALLAVWAALDDLAVPGRDGWIDIAVAALAAGLVWYLWWSVRRFIDRYAQAAPTPNASDKPTAIPPEILAATLQSLARCADCQAMDGTDALGRTKWLTAAKSAAAEMVKLLETSTAELVDVATQMTGAAGQASTSVSPPDNPESTKALARATALATTADEKLAAGIQAVKDGDEATARARLAEAVAAASSAGEQSQKAIEVGRDVTAAPGLDDALQVLGSYSELATSPGDDVVLAPSDAATMRRPITRSMI